MRDKLLSYSVLHSKPTTSWLVRIWNTFGVGTSHGQPWTHYGPDSGVGGSHHLPPYSILCITPPHPHLNGSLSRDSQSGVSKLSRFGLPGLWAFITSLPDLRLGRGLKQTCSSPRELSNGVSHFTCTHQDRVDSQLLVVGSQTANLTSGLFFNHNLCYRRPNGSCEAISDIYISRPFQRYKKHLNARCFDPCNHVLNFWESQRTPKSHFSGV
jgi:hypothetical protein